MSAAHTIYCLGEVWLALDTAGPLTLTAAQQTIYPRAGGPAAALALACADRCAPVSLLAQVGEDAAGRTLAAALATAGVDMSRVSFSQAFPTPLQLGTGREALSYRRQSAGLQLAPEQLQPFPFQAGDALLFASSGLCDSPLRYTHLAALAATWDSGTLTCFAPCLCMSSGPEEAPTLPEMARLLLPRADIAVLNEAELPLLFGTTEMRVALFSLLRGHTQLILLCCGDGLHAFTRTAHAFLPGAVSTVPQMAAAALSALLQQDFSPQKLPRLTVKQLAALLG